MDDILIINIKELIGILPPEIKVLTGAELSKVKSLTKAWLHISGQRITDFGEMASLPKNLVESCKIIDATGKLVLPSYVDSHTHLVYAGTREDEFEMRLNGLSYADIAKRGGGILNSAKKLADTSEAALLTQSLARLNDVINMGTGAIEIKSGYGLSVAGELKMLRTAKALKNQTDAIIKTTFLALHAVPQAYTLNADAYVDLMINEVLPQVAEEGLADYVDAFCEEGYFSVAQTEQLLIAAAKYGLKPKVHVNQFNAIGGIAACVKHKAISVDHLEVMAAEDFNSLANSATIATLLPICSLFIKIPYAPARTLLQHDAKIALATDFNPGSSPSGNMQLVQSLACTQMNLTPIEAFNAATINGAAALELSDELGSITRGKRANLIITKEIPSLTYIPYNVGHNHVEMHILNGRVQGL